MKIVAILQARMGSSRLPGKMLLPLLDRPLVAQVIERVRRAPNLDMVVLAYPVADHHIFKPILNAYLDTAGVPLGAWAQQGDESNLVERYLGAARAYGADLIVRVPCDNPCIDPAYINVAVEEYLTTPHLWYSNTTAQCGQVWLDGIGCEISSVSRWQWLAERIAQEPSGIVQALYREHPHQYFYDHDDLSGMIQIDGRFHHDAVKLDVNTQSEYEKIRDLYAYFGHNRFTSQEIVSYLSTQEVSYEEGKHAAQR